MAERVWKGVYPKVFGSSCQHSLNKFFDPSTPSMRKVVTEEKKRGETGEKVKLRCWFCYSISKPGCFLMCVILMYFTSNEKSVEGINGLFGIIKTKIIVLN